MPPGNTTQPGRIEMICGPMFSGKSERLIERLSQAKAQALPAVAFKHADDDRYDARHIVTHSGRRMGALPVSSAAKILELAGDARLVAIDEAQFFAVDLVEVCRQLTQQGRTVIVAGLDRDSWGEPFGAMPDLERIADVVIRTQAVCSACGGVAERTQRLVPVEGTRMVGGPEAYEPRCTKCFVPPPIELRR